MGIFLALLLANLMAASSRIVPNNLITFKCVLSGQGYFPKSVWAGRKGQRSQTEWTFFICNFKAFNNLFSIPSRQKQLQWGIFAFWAHQNYITFVECTGAVQLTLPILTPVDVLAKLLELDDALTMNLIRVELNQQQQEQQEQQ